jgi:hypothetical protein
VDSGKLVTAAAFNLPTPTIGSGTCGPPWVISVGGVESVTHGEQPRAAKLVDVVSDYTRLIPGSEPDAYENASGTSLGAPLVAGVLANSVLDLRSRAREAGGAAGVLCSCRGRNVTNADFRGALNATAQYWNLTDYDPLNYSSDPILLLAFATTPILPAPWVQMGWGFVGPDTGAEVVRVLAGGRADPKPVPAVAYMAQQEALREAYWGPGPLAFR